MQTRHIERAPISPGPILRRGVITFGLLLALATGAAGLELAAGAFVAGGGSSSNGELALLGSLGDASAGVGRGGSLVLSGGVLAGLGDPSMLFIDGFESGGSSNWTSSQGGDNP